MNLFAIVDDHGDIENAPIVRETVDAMVDVLRHPYKPRPEGENALPKALQESVAFSSFYMSNWLILTVGSFWVRALKIATPSSVKHFIPAYADYLESNVVQAKHRDDDVLFQSVGDYLHLQRENIGARPAFFPCQMHLNIPDEALYHPIVVELKYLTCDMIAIDNVSLHS